MGIKKYQGVISTFYACGDANGAISPDHTRALARHLLETGARGLSVGGSSGECIYQSVAEQKLTIIAHVACNNTADSQERPVMTRALALMLLPLFLQSIFTCPHGIAEYWNHISAAAANTDFIIYKICIAPELM